MAHLQSKWELANRSRQRAVRTTLKGMHKTREVPSLDPSRIDVDLQVFPSLTHFCASNYECDSISELCEENKRGRSETQTPVACDHRCIIVALTHILHRF